MSALKLRWRRIIARDPSVLVARAGLLLLEVGGSGNYWEWSVDLDGNDGGYRWGVARTSTAAQQRAEVAATELIAKAARALGLIAKPRRHR